MYVCMDGWMGEWMFVCKSKSIYLNICISNYYLYIYSVNFDDWQAAHKTSKLICKHAAVFCWRRLTRNNAHSTFSLNMFGFLPTLTKLVYIHNWYSCQLRCLPKNLSISVKSLLSSYWLLIRAGSCAKIQASPGLVCDTSISVWSVYIHELIHNYAYIYNIYISNV